MRKLILALLLSLLAAPCVSAQSADADVVADVEEAYRQLQFEEAERTARRALENYGDLTVEELTEIHTFLALIAYNRGDLGEARRQFLLALQLTADMELDPVLVPPKIQTYFADVRAEAAADSPALTQAPTRYVLVRDPRPDAAVRSMLWPGWGQLYKGHTTKGYAFAGLFTAVAGGAVLAHIRRSAAENQYGTASTIDEASERYDAYNAWHRARNGFIQGAALVWAASYIDALLTGASPRQFETVAFNASPSSVSVRLRF